MDSKSGLLSNALKSGNANEIQSSISANNIPDDADSKHPAKDTVLKSIDKTVQSVDEIDNIRQEICAYHGQQAGGIVGAKINFAAGFKVGAICGLLISIVSSAGTK